MVGRAVEFLLAHPDPNPATGPVVTRLSGLRDRLEELARQHRTAQVAATAAVNLKSELRVGLEQQLAALRGIAQTAAVSDPGLTVHLRPLKAGVSEGTFLTTVRVAVAEALVRKDLLVGLGMPDTLLESMNGDLDRFEAALSRQQQALNAQIGAGAELALVSKDILGVVKHFDALHKLRFRKDPELLAAWKSARNVSWPGPAKTTTPPAEGTTAA
jgi:hypothetical protein